MRILILILLCGFTFTKVNAQQPEKALTLSPLISFDDYLQLANQVNKYRKDRLITLNAFNLLAQQPNVVILDTRSDSMYNAKHVKGAIHLNFSDFTQENLARLIPDNRTCILIYCNNNFTKDSLLTIEDPYFPGKSADVMPKSIGRLNSYSISPGDKDNSQRLTLALNIPTFINLYGYGYTNVYELGEMVATTDPRLLFEGTAVNAGN